MLKCSYVLSIMLGPWGYCQGDGDGDEDEDEDEDWMFRPNNQAMLTLPLMAENRFRN